MIDATNNHSKDNCRAVKAWAHSSKRNEDFRGTKKHLETVMKHVIVRTTSSMRFSSAIAELCGAITLFGRERIQCPNFDMDSETREHSDKNELGQIITNIDLLYAEVGDKIKIDDGQLHKDIQKELSTPATNQRFTGGDIANKVLEVLISRLIFWYVYLKEKNVLEQTGIIRYVIVYGKRDLDDGSSEEGGTGASSGAYLGGAYLGVFEEKVSLPFDGSAGLVNPLFYPAAAKYLKEEWLKKSAMWTRGALDLVQLATGMVIKGNNQHSEGVFSYRKNNINMADFASEPALYMIMRWDSLLASSAQLVVNNREAKSTIQRRKNKMKKREREEEEMTKDAREVLGDNKSNAVWRKNNWRLDEHNLLERLEDCCARMNEKKMNNKR